MSLGERLKLAWAALAGNAGLQLPPEGRSSEENLGGGMSAFLSRYSTVNPFFEAELLATLKHLRLYNPDFSQYVSNLVSLANSGHQVTIGGDNDSQNTRLINRLNESASRLFAHGAGIDGLINAELDQAAWSGAISSEDVVNLAARRVEKVVLVPVEQIRFKYDPETFSYKPYQRSSAFGVRTDMGLIPLNETTYHYLAWQTLENSPYAKPPATAAVDAILDAQQPAVKNIKFVAQKLSLLGQITYYIARLRQRGGESDLEHEARSKRHLKETNDQLSGGFQNGLITTYQGNKVQFENANNGAQGFYDIFRVIEEQVMSGLSMQPAFFGRTDSTTETYADVVYNLLLAQVTNLQRIAKRRRESTYRLDLRLAGENAEGLALSFNKPHSRNRLADAQADQVELQVVIEKVKNGIISPDQGAQELGYASAFDPELITDHPAAAQLFSEQMPHARPLTMKFNSNIQAYEYVPETLSLSESSAIILPEHEGNVIHLKKKRG